MVHEQGHSFGLQGLGELDGDAIDHRPDGTFLVALNETQQTVIIAQLVFSSASLCLSNVTQLLRLRSLATKSLTLCQMRTYS